MDRATGLKTKLSLPAISQIGIVVRDMQEAVEYYQGVFGLGPWTVNDSTPDKYWFKGKPSHMRLRQGKAMLGGVELEQPLEGESTFHEFLQEHGEGLHHLAFNTEDYDATVRRFEEAGFKPLLQAKPTSRHTRVR